MRLCVPQSQSGITRLFVDDERTNRRVESGGPIVNVLASDLHRRNVLSYVSAPQVVVTLPWKRRVTPTVYTKRD